MEPPDQVAECTVIGSDTRIGSWISGRRRELPELGVVAIVKGRLATHIQDFVIGVGQPKTSVTSLPLIPYPHLEAILGLDQGVETTTKMRFLLEDVPEIPACEIRKVGMEGGDIASQYFRQMHELGVVDADEALARSS